MFHHFSGFAGGCSWLVVALLLASGAAQAQRAPGRSPPRAAPAPAPLPPAQVEEALRLLLQRTDSASKSRARGPEAAGLVLDQTLTKVGRDFFDLFYTAFEPPPGVLDYTITIAERPGRLGPALVALTVNDIELLEMPLSPQYDPLVESVGEAVAAARGLLLETQRVSRQLEAGRRAPLETY